MRKFKKIAAIVLSIAMILSLISVNVFAAGTNEVHYILEATPIENGQFTLNVYVADSATGEIANADGFYLSQTQMILEYDNTAISIVDASKRSNAYYNGITVTQDSTVKFASLNASGTEFKGKEVPAAVLTCTVLDETKGSVTFKQTELKIKDENVEQVPDSNIFAEPLTVNFGGDTPDPTPTATAAPVETATPTATAAPTDAPEANRVTVNVGTAIVGRDFTITVNRTDASEEATVEVTLTPAKEGAAPVTKTVTFAAGETKLTVTIPSDEMENIAENGESFDVNVVYNGSEEPIEKSSTATMRKGGSNTGNSGYTTGSDGVIGGSTPKPGPSTDDTTEPTEAPVVTTEPSNVVFEDVPATYWGYDYIMDLYENGIVNGTTATLFMPEANVTRAEFTKMAAGIFGLTATSTVSQFTDVPAGEWFTPYVIAASEAGIVQGVSETEFAPNDNVTREQMAAIIGRQLGTTSTAAITFTDAASIEDYARPYVAALAEAGYLTGDETGAFNPKNNATRAEAAALLDRVYVDLTVAEPTEAPEATEEPEVTAEPEATAEVEATEAPEATAEATETPAE